MLAGLCLDEGSATSELAAVLLCGESDGITEIFVEVTMDSSNRDGSEEVRVEGVSVPPIMYPYPVDLLHSISSRSSERHYKTLHNLMSTSI